MPPVNRPRPGQKTQAQAPKKSTGSNSATVGIIIVIAVLALIAAGYFFGLPYLPYLQKYLQKSPTEAIVLENTPADTAATQNPDGEALNEPEPEVPPAEDIVVKQESSSSAPKGYYIIVGSFRYQSNADRMVQNTRKDIKLETVYFEELGLYRVSAGHYDNIHTAYNDTYSVKDLEGCGNAWVLENR
ncbi:MAG: SPOR domain-containing protein [Bacteroidales bacterium]|jgi:cell division protein FtsN|nr:SPOR domain-containing protein [Bacteroidales bacterium]